MEFFYQFIVAATVTARNKRIYDRTRSILDDSI